MEVEVQEDLHTKTDSGVVVVSGIRKESVFKSCLELQELAQQAGNPDLRGSMLEVQNSSYESNASSPVQSTNIDELSSTSTPTSSGCHKSPKSESGLQEVEKDAPREVRTETAYASPSVTGDTERSSEQVDMPVSNGRVDDSHQTTSLEDASNANEVLEPHTETSNNTNEVLEPHNETSSNANEVLEPQTEISSKGDQIHSGLGKPSVTKLVLFDSIITCLIIACIYLLIIHIIIFRI
jgi:phosphatidate phosphatase LPIN